MKRTKILSWMLKRLKVREFDSNKGAIGETLAVLLQTSQANVQKLAAMNGIDILLQVRCFSLLFYTGMMMIQETMYLCREAFQSSLATAYG